MQPSDRDRSSDPPAGPRWLDAALARRARAEEAVPEGFLNRCASVTAVAAAVRTMRGHQERTPFTPRPLSTHLRDLAERSRAPLAPVLSFFRVADLGTLQAATAAGLGRLARAVGLRLEEAQLRLRIEYAAELGRWQPAPPLLYRDPDPGAGAGQARCETQLAEVEETYASTAARQLMELQAALTQGYKAGTGQEPR